MEHEKAYVFSSERPAKRRRVERSDGLDSSLPLRHQLYHDLWTEQQQRIDEVIKSANEATLDEVSTFIRDQGVDRNADGLPAGFLLAGPSIAAHSLIFQQLQERSRDEANSIFIPVSSSDGGNLKTLLKAIIKNGTSQKRFDEDEVDLLPSKTSGRKLLDYDLQLLHEFIKEKNVQQCIVVFRDCEAFDSSVLSEVIELLS
jgi:origin recognition complex subunit 3